MTGSTVTRCEYRPRLPRHCVPRNDELSPSPPPAIACGSGQPACQRLKLQTMADRWRAGHPLPKGARKGEDIRLSFGTIIAEESVEHRAESWKSTLTSVLSHSFGGVYPEQFDWAHCRLVEGLRTGKGEETEKSGIAAPSARNDRTGYGCELRVAGCEF